MAKREKKPRVKLAIVGRGFGRQKTLLIEVPLADFRGPLPPGLSVERSKGGYQVNMVGGYGDGVLGVARLQVRAAGMSMDFETVEATPETVPDETLAAVPQVQGDSGGYPGTTSIEEDDPRYQPDSSGIGDAAIPVHNSGEYQDKHPASDLDALAEASHRELTVVQDENV